MKGNTCTHVRVELQQKRGEIFNEIITFEYGIGVMLWVTEIPPAPPPGTHTHAPHTHTHTHTHTDTHTHTHCRTKYTLITAQLTTPSPPPPVPNYHTAKVQQYAIIIIIIINYFYNAHNTLQSMSLCAVRKKRLGGGTVQVHDIRDN